MSSFASFVSLDLLGNVGSEPTLRYMPSGLAALNVSMAVDQERVTFQNNERVILSETVWWNIPLFGKVAEDVANLVHKGSKVMLKGGYPQIREYVTKDGEVKTKLEGKGGRFIVLEANGKKEWEQTGD